jgi:hypothetical protein
MFSFNLFSITGNGGCWFILFEFRIFDWTGSLLMVGRTDYGEWQFDFLFLRGLYHNLLNKIEYELFEEDNS